ncbi:MAG TPA: hypothetical protein PLY87_18280 [Planctomycetaceae bacterium]|nr:hypothetical protein [Planctomycetaceae bacterium]
MAIDLCNCVLRVWRLAAFVCVLSLGTTGYAQLHAGQIPNAGFGGGGQTLGGFNSSVGFASQYPIGDRSLGGTYSSPRYTYGAYTVPYFGVSRGYGYGYGYGYGHGYGYGYGAWNYSTGYYAPVIWSAPYATYSPSVFGYGSSVLSGNYVGNYVSNGFVGLIPGGAYSPYYSSGWPYITGLSPYSPAAIIAPTILNLNVITQPLVPSVASYSLTDPRLIDQLAPVPQPGGVVVPPPPQPADFDGAIVPDEPAWQVPGDGTPILNEFDSVPREQKVSTLTEKIQSLRYQSSGDDAFQKADYATADVFYSTAIKTAPDRRAPYLRMAISRITLNDFPEAARYLKTGLAMESDASRAWVTAEELYGQKIAERARSHGGPLWNWLAERPLSADRLLLAGTFQKLRGYDRTADQMLELASHEGTEAMLVSQVQQLAKQDVGPRSISDDVNHIIDQESSRRATAAMREIHSAQQRSVEQSGGIFLRSSDETPGMRGPVQTSRLENAPPQPNWSPPKGDPETAPVPFTIPVIE